MHEITDIYKGYLDLIEYLEEKFPGCVEVPKEHDNTIVVTSKKALHLLTVAPVTKVTTDRFICASCSRFNTLGTAHLHVYRMGDCAQVYTPRVTPLLGILYYLAYKVSPAHIFPAIPNYTEMIALKLWMKGVTASRIHSLDLKGIMGALNVYVREHGEGHIETMALKELIDEQNNQHL